MRRPVAIAATVLIAITCALLVVLLTDVPLRARVPGRLDTRAAVAIRDDVTPFQKWGSREFTLPYIEQHYGRAWHFNHQKTFFRENGSAAKQWLKPEGNPQWGPNWDEDHGAGDYPQQNHYFYLPRLCNHCTHPACRDACPRHAIEKREQDGIVVVNQDRCHGYRFCVEACPYKKVFFDTERQVAAKCIFCFPRVEEGVAPACARQCP